MLHENCNDLRMAIETIMTQLTKNDGNENILRCITLRMEFVRKTFALFATQDEDQVRSCETGSIPGLQKSEE